MVSLSGKQRSPTTKTNSFLVWGTDYLNHPVLMKSKLALFLAFSLIMMSTVTVKAFFQGLPLKLSPQAISGLDSAVVLPKIWNNNNNSKSKSIRSSIRNRGITGKVTISGDGHSNSVPVLDPLVVCGPSGVGKGTIIERFMKSNLEDNNQNTQQQLQFGFSTSHTTRQPRPGEVDGVHYHFTSQKKMKTLISKQQQQQNHDETQTQGFFMEYAEVHGNFYGTSWDALLKVQESGRKCLLDIDVQGVRRLKELEQQQQESNNNNAFVFAPKYIFIAPPGLKALQDRLRKRATETPESLQVRLANAAAEVAYGQEPGNFDAVVVNDDLEAAVREFEKAVHKLYN